VRPHHVAAIAAEFQKAEAVSRYSYISSLGSWLRRIGCGAATTGLGPNPRPGPRERVVSEVEYEAALRAASPVGQLALILAHDCGLRAGTIVRLCRHNLDFRRGEISGRTKNAAYFRVPMTARAREKLLWAGSLADPEETLLAAISRHRQPVSVQDLDHHVRVARKRAAIGSRWVLHDLRRTAARRVYERTRDVRKVQQLLAHRNLYQTVWYLGDVGGHLTAADLEPAPPGAAPERKTA